MCFLKLTVLLTVTVALLLAAVHAADICDTCKCARVQGEVKSVSCDCNTENKVLNLSRDKMDRLMHITSFAVSNCSSVTFEQNSFAKSHDLQSVSISRVNHVTIRVGVFSSLSSLLVEDVSDLQLAKMGLLGAGDVQDITIHRSNISVLPTFAFFDVKGLRKVELKGVHIGVMKVQSIGLTMADDSRFIIESSLVETIERGAVSLHTSNLAITESHFHTINYQAVNVSATTGTEIMKNVFGAGCSNQGIIVSSNIIEIDRNTFNVLPIGLLKKVKDSSSSVKFTNNIVYNFTLTSGGVDLSTMLDLHEFSNNEVVCDCNLAKSVLAYKGLQTASEARVIVQRNYCYSDSSCKLSLAMLAEEQTQVCEGEDNNNNSNIDALCESLPEEHSSAAVSAITPQRGGRAGDFTEPPTTETPPTTTLHDEHHAHEAAPHQTESAAWRFSANLFYLLIMVMTSSKLFGI